MTAPVPGRGSRHRGGSVCRYVSPVSPFGRPSVTLQVYGTPKPKGSMRHVGHGRLVEQIDNADWRADVKGEALRLLTGNGLPVPLFPDGPVEVTVFLFVPKPKSAPKRRRTWPVTRSSGDVDKHLRLILDALTGITFADDSQVVHAAISKEYHPEVGATITVYRPLDWPGES